MYQITVHPGRTLWEELAEQKIAVDRPCGGKGTCGRCSVVLRGGRTVLACQYRTVGEVEIEELPEHAAGFTAVGMHEDREPYIQELIAAADVGTTTVVLRLLYHDYIIEKSFVNPQRVYGADVMSRIRAANEDQLEELCRLIREPLSDALRSAFRELVDSMSAEGPAGLPHFSGCRLIVSANTTMQHLLEGLSCRRLGIAPFVPERMDRRSFSMDGAEVIQLPGISAFVGADVVSGLSVIDILHRGEPTLFIDLGTNGEMALGCGKRLLVTSTAAGPAFEGSELALHLHGAGILALLHQLLADGIIDEYGTLDEQYFDSGFPVEGVCVLTQEEIREFQVAKAAVCAGVESLLKVYGIAAGQVEQVYLAGGFGYFLDPEDALAVGLLPEGLRGRITAIGNASLEGAVRYAADPNLYGMRMEEICDRAEHVSLPDCEGFEERYIERMNFGLHGD